MENLINDPIDLEHFNSFTAGDIELSKALIEAFFESAKIDLIGLEKNIELGSKRWKEHAHSFKGASLTLGANELGKLLRSAELALDDVVFVRNNLFKSISDEYRRVEEFLKIKYGM